MIEQNSFQSLDGGSIPTSPLQDIKKTYRVLPCSFEDTHPWLKLKHYAHRIPPIMYSFGIYKNKNLEGVITFGMPTRMMNDGECLFKENFKVETIELNRLVLNENCPRNTESYFISKALKLLPKPICIVSYADSNFGHHGYIYQATNWYFTGITPPRSKFIDKRGNDIHERTIWSRYGNEENALKSGEIIKSVQQGKYRYFIFLGNKEQIKKMKILFQYRILPYPKGDNKRYDASFKPEIQSIFF